MFGDVIHEVFEQSQVELLIIDQLYFIKPAKLYMFRKIQFSEFI